MLSYLVLSCLPGGKATYYEGGIRVPGIVRWPGHVPSSTENNNIVSLMDIFTTFVLVAGGKVPSDRVIDGKDISKQLFALKPVYFDIQKETILHADKRTLFFYCNTMLFAVRHGSYKIHFYTMPVDSKESYSDKCSEGGFPTQNYFNCLYCPSPCVLKHDPPLIYNVDADPGEEYALNPSLHEELLLIVDVLIKEHNLHLIIGEDLLSAYNKGSEPCCDSSNPTCSCNYP